MSNDGIKLDSCLPSISNNSKYSIKQLRNVLFGYSVVLINFSKRKFLNLDLRKLCALFLIEK